MHQRIRDLRDAISGAEERLDALRAELAEALAEAGRRPGDGSDQATLFDVAEPNLFGGECDDYATHCPAAG